MEACLVGIRLQNMVLQSDLTQEPVAHAHGHTENWCTQRTGAGQSGVLCNPCRELFLQRTVNTEQFSASTEGAENCFCREFQTQNTALYALAKLVEACVNRSQSVSHAASYLGTVRTYRYQ